MVFPENAGLPLGGEGAPRFVMVEIHYNNVEKHAGYIDRSGFRLHMTQNLREHDAGIIELGLIYSDANSIPPGQMAFPITGYCTADCTNKVALCRNSQSRSSRKKASRCSPRSYTLTSRAAVCGRRITDPASRSAK